MYDLSYLSMESIFILKGKAPFEFHIQEIRALLDGLATGLSVRFMHTKKTVKWHVYQTVDVFCFPRVVMTQLCVTSDIHTSLMPCHYIRINSTGLSLFA